MYKMMLRLLKKIIPDSLFQKMRNLVGHYKQKRDEKRRAKLKPILDEYETLLATTVKINSKIDALLKECNRQNTRIKLLLEGNAEKTSCAFGGN